MAAVQAATVPHMTSVVAMKSCGFLTDIKVSGTWATMDPANRRPVAIAAIQYCALPHALSLLVGARVRG